MEHILKGAIAILVVGHIAETILLTAEKPHRWIMRLKLMMFIYLGFYGYLNMWR